jgi:hypothetical protein
VKESGDAAEELHQFTSGELHDGLNTLDGLLPRALGEGELLTAGGSEGVELGATIGFGEGPFGAHPLVLIHAVEGRIERALFDAEEVAGDALDVEDDAVAVEGGAVREGLENEELKGSLKIVLSHSGRCLEV